MGKLFLYLISIFWIIIGVLSVFATDLVRNKFFNKLLKNKDMKKLAPIPIVIGILLFLSASANNHAIIVILIGILAIGKGVMLIVAEEKMQKLTDWWLKSKDSAYKIYGVVIILLGSIVLMGIK